MIRCREYGSYIPEDTVNGIAFGFTWEYTPEGSKYWGDRDQEFEGWRNDRKKG